MQQQSPQLFGMPTQQPTNIISTEQIQKYLDENKQLILAIMESQNLGKINECAQYQAQLQKNLMYLAAIADAQPPASSTGPSQTQAQPQSQPQPQTPVQSAVPQGSPMQPPQPAFNQNQQLQQQMQLQLQQQQQQTVGYGARMGFMGQSYDQQSHLIQQQQTMAGMMGLRMGGTSGLHPALQTGNFMDGRTRQDGPEAGSGDGQGR